jgi:hypothetical protein
MSKFFLVMKQEGGGCDYTIACGTKVVPLTADNLEAAKIEVRCQLLEEDDDVIYGYLVDPESDEHLEEAYIVELSHQVDIAAMGQEVVDARNKREASEEESAARAQLAALKERFPDA